MTNRVEYQYESAVFARAKADLLPDIATVHTKDKGDHLAERSEQTRSELLAESQRIIRNMKGLNRSSVDLL
ncbi:head completion/stabilization protein [Vibrio olivae]